MIKYAKIIDENTGLVAVGEGNNYNFFKKYGFNKLNVQQSDIDNQWYLTEKCPTKTSDEKLQEARQNKYAEITEKYDYANKYLVFKVDEDQELYANVSWYQTWNKVISLAQQLSTQSSNTSLPNAVRFYKLTSEGKLYNKNIENLEITKLTEYFNKVQFAQFNILQPIRNKLYQDLLNYKTLEDINSLEVDFGLTLNEQDMTDVNLKLDLTYTQ